MLTAERKEAAEQAARNTLGDVANDFTIGIWMKAVDWADKHPDTLWQLIKAHLSY